MSLTPISSQTILPETPVQQNSPLIALHKDLLQKIWEFIEVRDPSRLMWRESCRRFSQLFPVLPKNEWRESGTEAAERGYLNILKWAKANHFRLGPYILQGAIKGEHEPILNWLISEKEWSIKTHQWHARAADPAAAKGNVSRLKWLDLNGFKFDHWNADQAALGGHFEAVKWFDQKVYIDHSAICIKAAASGSIPILEWIKFEFIKREQYKLCNSAAQNGHLDILNWLYGKNLTPDRSISQKAADGGHQHILEWILAHNIQFHSPIFSLLIDPRQPIDIAAQKGHLHIVQWLVTHGAPITEETVNVAQKHKQEAVVAWLEDQRDNP